MACLRDQLHIVAYHGPAIALNALTKGIPQHRGLLSVRNVEIEDSEIPKRQLSD